MGSGISRDPQRDSELVKHVKEVFREVLKDLLGSAGLSALEHYLNRKLNGDMYDVLAFSPPLFYNALKSFLGKGADAILRISANKLIMDGKISGLSPEEFVDLMKSSSEEAYKRLLNSFRRV